MNPMETIRTLSKTAPTAARRSAWAVALLFLACLGLPSTAARAQLFDAQYFTLSNGLEIVVIENHIAHNLTQMMSYKVVAA